MKVTILTLFLLLLPFMLFSQSGKLDLKAPLSPDDYQQLYRLDAQQQKQVLELQKEFLDKEAQLSSLKTSDYERYLDKRINLKSVMERSLYRLLNQEQRKIFIEQQKRRDKKESALIAKLKKQGADAVRIKEALLQVE